MHVQLDLAIRRIDGASRTRCGMCFPRLAIDVSGLPSLHSLANPWESAQYGDDDEDIGNNARRNDSWVLDSAVSDDVNDLKYKPSRHSISHSRYDTVLATYAAPDRAHPEWMPPTCCSTDVAAYLTRSGAHFRGVNNCRVNPRWKYLQTSRRCRPCIESASTIRSGTGLRPASCPAPEHRGDFLRRKSARVQS